MTVIHQAIVAKRRVLRAAFDLIRHKVDQRKLVTKLAKALGGSGELTNELYQEATILCELNNMKDLVDEAARLTESAKAIERSRRNIASKNLILVSP